MLARQYQGQYYGAPGLAAGYMQPPQQGQATGAAGWQQDILLQEQQRQQQLAAVLGYQQVRWQSSCGDQTLCGRIPHVSCLVASWSPAFNFQLLRAHSPHCCGLLSGDQHTA